MTMTIRHMQRTDLLDVVECEVRRHGKIDPEFNTPYLPSYAWTADAILEAVRQRKTPGSHDTRSVVVTIPVTTSDGQLQWVCGAMIYELRPEGYHILLLTQLPDAPPTVTEALLGLLYKKASLSPNRKAITALVPDGDDHTLKILMGNKFKVKLLRDGFSRAEGIDGWDCSFQCCEPVLKEAVKS